MHTMQPKITMANSSRQWRRQHLRRRPNRRDKKLAVKLAPVKQPAHRLRTVRGHCKSGTCSHVIQESTNAKYRPNPKLALRSSCMLSVSICQVILFHRHQCWFATFDSFSAVPKTEPIGDTVRYVKEGSRVALHCVVSGAIDPPLYVIWYHGQQQIFPDNARQWKTEISHQLQHNDDVSEAKASHLSPRKTVSYLLKKLGDCVWGDFIICCAPI